MLGAQFTSSAEFEDFAYGAPSDDVFGLRLKVSVFADSARLRRELRDDVRAAGLRAAGAIALTQMLTADDGVLGDIVLVDCPQADGAALATLAHLDMLAGRSGAMVIVSTSVEALDDVFASLDQCQPQILIDPSRAERLVALGQALARMPARRVRELTEEDRLVLLRLTQQVMEIGEKLSVLSPPLPAAAERPAAREASAFRFDASAGQGGGDRLVQDSKGGLPDPRMIRRMIRQRQQRARFFDGDLFADPAWDMLLDLVAAEAERVKVSVTSLCIASGVPPTTALRWIGQMTEAGLLQRMEDESDRRRAFIALTQKASEAMSAYFSEIGNATHRMI